MKPQERSLHARWHALRLGRVHAPRRRTRVFAVSGLLHAGAVTLCAGWAFDSVRAQPKTLVIERRELSYAEVTPTDPLPTREPREVEPERVLDDATTLEPELVEIDAGEEPELAPTKPTLEELDLVAAPRVPMRFASRATPLQREPEPEVVMSDPHPHVETTTEVAEPETLVAAHPRTERNSAPAYPPLARRRGLEGTTVVRVIVHADGSLGEVALAQSSGSALLDDAALAAVRAWSFAPARRGATLLESTLEVPIEWRLVK